MKNIFAGVALAFVIPHISYDVYFIASAFFVAFVVCMALLVALRLIQRNSELQIQNAELQMQLIYSEERRRSVSQRRPRKASMRKGAA